MNREQRLKAINAEMQKRILILDGSMGAYLQGFGLNADDYHSTRFEEHSMSLKGNADLLVLTRPDVIKKIHEGYLAAGADIVSTDTFTANPVSQAEYALDEITRELNVEGARIAREACDAFEAKDKRPRIVAGAVGPPGARCVAAPRSSAFTLLHCRCWLQAAANTSMQLRKRGMSSSFGRKAFASSAN